MPDLHENLFGDMVPLPRVGEQKRESLAVVKTWEVYFCESQETEIYATRAEATDAIEAGVETKYVCPTCDDTHDYEWEAENCCPPKESHAVECPHCGALVSLELIPETWDSQEPPPCPECNELLTDNPDEATQ